MKKVGIICLLILLIFNNSCVTTNKEFNKYILVKGEKVKHGCWITYNESPQNYTITNYKRGKEHGGYYVYFKNNAILVKGKYKNGLKTGKWISCTSNGDTISYSEYRNGKQIKLVILKGDKF